MPPTKTPGPANFTMKPLVGYKDHDFSSLKQRAPQWTLGVKKNTQIENKSPGPGAYNVQKFTRFGKNSSPEYQMYGRTKDLKADTNPGPVHNPTDTCLYKWRCAPKFSVALNTKPLRADVGPGPSTAPTPVDVYKTRMPKYPMFRRIKDLPDDKVPGPGAYNSAEKTLKMMKQNPEYSMRSQTVDPLVNKDKIPGPPNYDLSKYNPFEKYPAFSLRRRHSEYVHIPVVPMDSC